MAVFDESKIINALNKDKAEIGKKYWYSDYIGIIKEKVESDDIDYVEELIGIDDDNHCCFNFHDCMYELLYPYEEPPKKRMTNRQLAEWCAKGNGECTTSKISCTYISYDYEKGRDEMFVLGDYVIRAWDSDEWVEPTVDIYERDCKGGK